MLHSTHKHLFAHAEGKRMNELTRIIDELTDENFALFVALASEEHPELFLKVG